MYLEKIKLDVFVKPSASVNNKVIVVLALNVWVGVIDKSKFNEIYPIV